jgi:hypothetical protein
MNKLEKIEDKNSTEYKEASELLKNRKNIGKKSTNNKKHKLRIESEHSYPKPFTKKDITDALNKLDSLDKFDEMRIKTMERRNTLETYLFDKKQWLDSEDANKYALSNEVEHVTDELKKVNEWYEDEGFKADFNSLDNKLKNLQNSFNPIELRIDNHKNRFNAEEKFFKFMNQTQNDALNLVNNKPWVQEHFNNNFTTVFKETKEWFDDLYHNQLKRSYFDVKIYFQIGNSSFTR